jgi:UDP-N-acetyl-D-glucosamine dehydrogenase
MTLTPLLSSIEARTARVGVVGLGYVGLPLILRLAEAGFPVTGFDINLDLLAQLRRGASPFTHIPDNDLASLAREDIVLTDDFSAARDLDAVLICLPTPLDRHRQPDLSYVVNSANAIAPHLTPQTLVSLESTTWPGTTEEVLAPILRAQGLEPGRDIALVFSPEREDPGNRTFTIRQIPKVVGGVTPVCLKAGEALYGAIVDTVVPVSSTRAAELTKLLENIQRSVNIGLMNEMKTIAHAMGIDIFEVIDAASTKPFGFTRYTPGPGLGGHCIPIDPFYLTWKAREYGIDTRFIELAGQINRRMPQYVLDQLVRRLSEVSGKALQGARVIVLGLAYKPNINDIRESPALEILTLLQQRGAEAVYHDPFCPEIPSTREYGALKGTQSVEWMAPWDWDAAIVVTNHAGVDYDGIAKRSSIVIDTRNVYSLGSRRLLGNIYLA